MENEIRKQLFKLQDKKYKEFHKGLCPGVSNIIGIRVPVLRKYSKELYTTNQFDDLLKQIGDDYYEEMMLKGMIIGLEQKKDINYMIPYIKKFISKIDNWAVCDTFCAGLKITLKNKETMWDFINEYLKSKNEFELRFSIVMMLDYYIEDNYILDVLNNLNNIVTDKYYVQMAIAWAISICLIKYYDETKSFLLSPNCKIDKFTYNKSIQKAIESYRIDDLKKYELKKMKK